LCKELTSTSSSHSVHLCMIECMPKGWCVPEQQQFWASQLIPPNFWLQNFVNQKFAQRQIFVLNAPFGQWLLKYSHKNCNCTLLFSPVHIHKLHTICMGIYSRKAHTNFHANCSNTQNTKQSSAKVLHQRIKNTDYPIHNQQHQHNNNCILSGHPVGAEVKVFLPLAGSALLSFCIQCLVFWTCIVIPHSIDSIILRLYCLSAWLCWEGRADLLYLR